MRAHRDPPADRPAADLLLGSLSRRRLARRTPPLRRLPRDVDDQAAPDRRRESIDVARPGVTIDGDRPQDVGRRHRRSGQPSAATADLLSRYQEAMRQELAGVLVELEGKPPDQGLGMVEAAPVRPSLADRMRLWDLAIKLGRELGTAIEAAPDAAPADPATPRRRLVRGRVDYG